MKPANVQLAIVRVVESNGEMQKQILRCVSPTPFQPLPSPHPKQPRQIISRFVATFDGSVYLRKSRWADERSDLLMNLFGWNIPTSHMHFLPNTWCISSQPVVSLTGRRHHDNLKSSLRITENHTTKTLRRKVQRTKWCVFVTVSGSSFTASFVGHVVLTQDLLTHSAFLFWRTPKLSTLPGNDHRSPYNII